MAFEHSTFLSVIAIPYLSRKSYLNKDSTDGERPFCFLEEKTKRKINLNHLLEPLIVMLGASAVIWSPFNIYIYIYTYLRAATYWTSQRGRDRDREMRERERERERHTHRQRERERERERERLRLRFDRPC